MSGSFDLSVGDNLNVQETVDRDLESEIYVEITQANVDAATGLDDCCDPLGKALLTMYPDSLWVVGPEVVCRYRESKSAAYQLTPEAIGFLKNWDSWWTTNALAEERNRERFPKLTGKLDFIFEGAKYPEEHIVPGYYAKHKR